MSERTVSTLVVAAVALGLLWALLPVQEPRPKAPAAMASLLPDMVPLVTGDEPIAEIFTRSGCLVCHTIPGIAGADGRVGPPLLLGSTGAGRLRDPLYQGRAKTVHEYVVESVLEPGVFVVPGYPPNTMPTWYGAKLSALALEKIASYLERQTTEPDGVGH
ncbi:MAG TPA: hypothetical protein VNI35_08475 [Nitrospira sp.]|nr:hypothetical protein [Nitrospira sp.]